MTTEALASPDHAASCRNCGAATGGNFCIQCGQATHLHVPSAREFLHEFVAHYVALEGKLWKSLMLLLFKPGFLTREYIEGRRARYVEPLRLYLTFSIIFFALFKLSGVEILTIGGNETTPPAISATADGKAHREARTVEANEAEQDSEEARDIEAGQRQLITKIDGFNHRLAKGTERFLALPPAQQKEAAKRAFFSYMPYAIFLMMPLFAFYLKLLYLGSGRRYGEHFLFALHSNAFAFFMLSLFILAAGWNFLRFVLLLWLVFYLPTAMRRVYGGGRALTALRWATLAFLHVLTMSIGVAIAVGVGMVV